MFDSQQSSTLINSVSFPLNEKNLNKKTYSRKQLTQWVQKQNSAIISKLFNQSSQIPRLSIQTLKNGIFFLSILCQTFPEQYQFIKSKINLKPLSEYDFDKNLQLMKKILNKYNLQMNLNTNQVIKSKNCFQLLNWFKNLYDTCMNFGNGNSNMLSSTNNQMIISNNKLINLKQFGVKQGQKQKNIENAKISYIDNSQKKLSGQEQINYMMRSNKSSNLKMKQKQKQQTTKINNPIKNEFILSSSSKKMNKNNNNFLSIQRNYLKQQQHQNANTGFKTNRQSSYRKQLQKIQKKRLSQSKSNRNYSTSKNISLVKIKSNNDLNNQFNYDSNHYEYGQNQVKMSSTLSNMDMNVNNIKNKNSQLKITNKNNNNRLNPMNIANNNLSEFDSIDDCTQVLYQIALQESVYSFKKILTNVKNKILSKQNKNNKSNEYQNQDQKYSYVQYLDIIKRAIYEKPINQ